MILKVRPFSLILIIASENTGIGTRHHCILPKGFTSSSPQTFYRQGNVQNSAHNLHVQPQHTIYSQPQISICIRQPIHKINQLLNTYILYIKCLFKQNILSVYDRVTKLINRTSLQMNNQNFLLKMILLCQTYWQSQYL